MSKIKNSMEKLARDAARRLNLARQHVEQLNFLPDEAGAPPVDTIAGKAGRPNGATNKGRNQMTEEVIAEIAGITSRDDAITAMTTSDWVLTWAHAGAMNNTGEEIKIPGAA